MRGEHNHPVWSENHDFSATEIQLTYGQSVNSSLSIVVQLKKNIALLYLSQFNHGGQEKFENAFFQIAKLKRLMIFADFRQNSRFFNKFSGNKLGLSCAKLSTA